MCRKLFPALALTFLFTSQFLTAQEPKILSFGALEPQAAKEVQAKAAAWLKDAGKSDAQTMQQFEALWKREDRTVVDLVADTFALGNPDAAKLLADGRNLDTPAPTKVPEIFKDAKQSSFFKANLGLAYARALSNRRIYEEALNVLKLFHPEQVVDPTAYLFHRAVAEHAMLLQPEADKSINRLLRDGLGTPDRYKTLAMLMLLDMQTWKDKDLGAVARKMENIERRLKLARGGPQTQKMQKEVIARLDELIKEMENKSKKKGDGDPKGGDPNGGGCPSGGQPMPGSGPPQGNNPSSPATQSGIATQGGTGKVDPQKMRKLVEEWGRLPPRDQAKALQELTQGLSPRHREAIENYFRNLAQASTSKR